ncbi:MAG: PIN domain-containing protein [Chloroflexota bacterium]
MGVRPQGWQIKLFDAIIAVTALRGGFTLLTTDKDFRGVPGLAQENWRE